MSKWKCGVCGFVSDGEEAPEVCPKCGASKDKFTKLEDDRAQLVERSRLTNSLHIQLYALLKEASEIAEQGIQDKLDPACVKIFTKAVAEAKTLQQMIKAEIEGHISKGKWG